MRVFPIKAFSDNYIWLVEDNKNLIIVDPGEAIGLLDYLQQKKFNQLTILLTHFHDDHTGGVKDILAKFPETSIYGPIETKQLNTTTVKENDQFEVYDQNFKVLKTSGHTKEHISYLMDNLLFCGDALFSAGCGRVFTGDYQAMFETMKKFRHLQDDVKVYAGHEYTETNLTFAHAMAPDNLQISKALQDVKELREKDLPTLPSTIGKEKQINLFLQAENLEEFINLRKAKDDF
ncbi:MAG TPA: hydroxyacylglutathione hydrolase [Candidatus Tetragenococcus pullicola]|nr:hydroxyacylglutathione hydrolase [Candidatus Tetragenococcus pullicola]